MKPQKAKTKKADKTKKGPKAPKAPQPPKADPPKAAGPDEKKTIVRRNFLYAGVQYTKGKEFDTSLMQPRILRMFLEQRFLIQVKTPPKPKE